jgi:hypothetical protein
VAGLGVEQLDGLVHPDHDQGAGQMAGMVVEHPESVAQPAHHDQGTGLVAGVAGVVSEDPGDVAHSACH